MKKTNPFYFEFPEVDGIPSLHEIDPTKQYLAVVEGPCSFEDMKRFSEFLKRKFPAIQACLRLGDGQKLKIYDLTKNDLPKKVVSAKAQPKDVEEGSDQREE